MFHMVEIIRIYKDTGVALRFFFCKFFCQCRVGNAGFIIHILLLLQLQMKRSSHLRYD